MASPKVLVQILVTGTRIVGKAFYEAGRQAVKNAKHSPQAAMGNDVAGLGNATSGSITDQLTRQHRMTVDEAQLILNVKHEDSLEQIIKHYEHLYKANSPAPKPEKPVSAKQLLIPTNSHYLQSKVVRARERIEAELKAKESPSETLPGNDAKAEPSSPPPEKPNSGAS